MVDRSEQVFQQCVEKKIFDSTITYKKEMLQRFFEEMEKQKYTGPFRKSMFIQHSTLISRCKEVGITLHKNRKTGSYFLPIEYEIEPVLFDTELLDLVEEEAKA